MKSLWLSAIVVVVGCSTLASTQDVAAVPLTQQFTGVGQGPTYNAAIEGAVRNATINAGNKGYSNCQVTNYVYYEDPTWRKWQAKAWVSCTKGV